jgi:hypothetical protein
MIETKNTNAILLFRQLMCERRAFPKGSPDHAYRTRAARHMIFIHRGVPASQWGAS